MICCCWSINRGMFVLQSKDALVVTKNRSWSEKKRELGDEKNSEQVRGQEPLQPTPLSCLARHGYQPQNTIIKLTSLLLNRGRSPRHGCNGIPMPEAIHRMSYFAFSLTTAWTLSTLWVTDALVFVYACFPYLDTPSRVALKNWQEPCQEPWSNTRRV